MTLSKRYGLELKTEKTLDTGQKNGMKTVPRPLADAAEQLLKILRKRRNSETDLQNNKN